jgi:hypothetical protein
MIMRKAEDEQALTDILILRGRGYKFYGDGLCDGLGME